MVKFTKILLTCTLILVIIIVAFQLYLVINRDALTSSGGKQIITKNNNQAPTNRATRQEVLAQYFKSLQLEKNVLKSGDQIVAKWQLQDKIADDPLFLIKIVDAQKNIFISETQSLPLKDYHGSAFASPKTAGQYELWFYVVQDNIESLVSILPFEVK